jgi:hypothetical protein
MLSVRPTHQPRNQQGTSVKKLTDIQVRPLLGATAGLLTMLLIASGSASPAAAQSSDAADKCTGDVMRLCSEFVPDADRIVVCLKAKRRQLSPACLGALTPAGKGGEAKGGGAAEKPRHHRRVRHHHKA